MEFYFAAFDRFDSRFRQWSDFDKPLIGQIRLNGGVGAITVADLMGVLLDFRAYDTLGEATVIFTSIIGAYVLLRHVGRKVPGAEEATAE